jgi:hypothetical protein
VEAVKEAMKERMLGITSTVSGLLKKEEAIPQPPPEVRHMR